MIPSHRIVFSSSNVPALTSSSLMCAAAQIKATSVPPNSTPESDYAKPVLTIFVEKNKHTLLSELGLDVLEPCLGWARCNNAVRFFLGDRARMSHLRLSSSWRGQSPLGMRRGRPGGAVEEM